MRPSPPPSQCVGRQTPLPPCAPLSNGTSCSQALLVSRLPDQESAELKRVSVVPAANLQHCDVSCPVATPCWQQHVGLRGAAGHNSRGHMLSSVPVWEPRRKGPPMADSSRACLLLLNARTA